MAHQEKTTNSLNELIEVYTSDGKPTGQGEPRSKIHSEGIWHKTVHTWILETSSGKLLVQKRSPNKLNHPNQWDTSSAGHISFGQSSDEASVREIEEELGIDVTMEELIKFETITVQLILNNETYLDNEFIDVYIVKRDHVDLSKLTLQVEEVCDAQLVHYRVVERCYELKHPDFVNLPNSEQVRERFFHRIAMELGEESKVYTEEDIQANWPSFIPKL